MQYIFGDELLNPGMVAPRVELTVVTKLCPIHEQLVGGVPESGL